MRLRRGTRYRRETSHHSSHRQNLHLRSGQVTVVATFLLKRSFFPHLVHPGAHLLRHFDRNFLYVTPSFAAAALQSSSVAMGLAQFPLRCLAKVFAAGCGAGAGAAGPEGPLGAGAGAAGLEGAGLEGTAGASLEGP